MFKENSLNKWCKVTAWGLRFKAKFEFIDWFYDFIISFEINFWG
jgi:hypothetical protein